MLTSRRRQHRGPHHLRARRRRGDAGAELHQALPRRVRVPHRAQALPGRRTSARRSAQRSRAHERPDHGRTSRSTARRSKCPQGSMVMDAADKLGIYVPHFCYHKKLSIAANCRMCLVEVEKAPKPLPACATPVTEGMKVRTAVGQGDQGAEGRDGVPADQPSARLPDLRPGRRVPAAGPRGRLRRLGARATARTSASCSTRTSAR